MNQTFDSFAQARLAAQVISTVLEEEVEIHVNGALGNWRVSSSLSFSAALCALALDEPFYDFKKLPVWWPEAFEAWRVKKLELFDLRDYESFLSITIEAGPHLKSGHNFGPGRDRDRTPSDIDEASWMLENVLGPNILSADMWDEHWKCIDIERENDDLADEAESAEFNADRDYDITTDPEYVKRMDEDMDRHITNILFSSIKQPKQ
jgi:hypothetical protein